MALCGDIKAFGQAELSSLVLFVGIKLLSGIRAPRMYGRIQVVISMVEKNERRQHFRHPREYRVVCSFLEEPFDTLDANSFNVSEGGLGLMTEAGVEVGMNIRLKIYASDNHLEPVIAEGTVRWQQPEEKPGDLVRSGIQFKRIRWTKLKELIPA